MIGTAICAQYPFSAFHRQLFKHRKSRATVAGFLEYMNVATVQAGWGLNGVSVARKTSPTNSQRRAHPQAQTQSECDPTSNSKRSLDLPRSLRFGSMGPISDCSPARMNTRWIASPLALTRTLMSLFIRRSMGASTAITS